jgi:hypothetical protein
MDDSLDMPYLQRMPTDVHERGWLHLPRSRSCNRSNYPSLASYRQLSRHAQGGQGALCGADQ